MADLSTLTAPGQTARDFRFAGPDATSRRMSTGAFPSSALVAGIDAGSNGMRFAIGRVEETGELRQLEHIRESVRLGADAFTTGTFSQATLDAAVAAFSRFAGLVKVNGIEYSRAVATSATRDASNGQALVARVLDATGIQIEIIDGLEEAQLVFAGVAAAVDLSDQNALLIDMGGGSIAITVARDAVVLASETFPLGSVRLLSQLRASGKSEADVEECVAPVRSAVADLIRTTLKGRSVDICVATGGNPECLGRLRGPLVGKAKLGKVKLSDLDTMIEALLELSPEQRSEKLDLRADRADVIVIAATVLRAILKDAGASRAITPGVGLVQGLIQQLAAGVRRARSAS